MHNSQRQQLRRRARLAIVLLVAAAVLGMGTVSHAAPADRLLPQGTVLYITIHDVPKFKAQFNKSSYGQLLSDPAMEAFLADVNEAIAAMSAGVEANIGMSIADLTALPQGEFTLAVTFADGAWAVVGLMHAGDNEQRVQELLDLASKKVVEEGSTRSEEEIDGTEVILFDAPEGEANPVQVAYFFRDGTLAVLLGAPGKMPGMAGDLLGRWDGAGENTLADQAVYQQVLQRTASDEGAKPLLNWYFDPVGLVERVSEFVPDPSFQQVLAFMPLLGLDKFKAIGGSFDMVVGPYDMVSRTYCAVEQPAGGVLHLFSWPNSNNLHPEPWVPSDLATYWTINWDLKLLWKTVGELYEAFLAQMFGQAQPGQFDAMVQAAAFNLGLDVKQDIIGPLGGRITFFSDFEDPTDAQSGRTLIAVALDDAERFSLTVDKLLGRPGEVQKREFQGHVIYEMAIPGAAMFGVPPLQAARAKPAKAGVSVAHDYVIFASNVTLLEKVLRDQEESLSDSLDFQLVAERFPEQANMLTFNRPEVNLRSYYEMARSGQLEEMFGMMPQIPPVFETLDFKKLPPFEAISRYLAPAASYGQGEDGGAVFVSYSLRKESP